MSRPLTPQQMIDAIRAEGCTVREYVGWRERAQWRSRERGHDVNGVVIHHTAGGLGSRSVEQYIADILVGDPAVPDKCNAAIDPDGVVWLVASGRANHMLYYSDAARSMAVNGTWPTSGGSVHARGNRQNGNAWTYGVECIAAGVPNQKQREAAVRWAAAMCRAHGWGGREVFGHGEAAYDRDFSDPGWDMSAFRADVVARLKAPKTTPTTPSPTGGDMKPALKDIWAKGYRHDGTDWILGEGDYRHNRQRSAIVQSALHGLYNRRSFKHNGRSHIAGKSLTRADLGNLRDFAFCEGIEWKGGLTWPLCQALARQPRLLDVRWFNGGHPVDVRYGEMALFMTGCLRWGWWLYDGKLGSETTAAVKAFQRKLGNRADGRLGPKQWAELARRSGLFRAPGMASKGAPKTGGGSRYVRPVDRRYPITARWRKPGSWAAGYHTGIDLGCPTGAPVYATIGGVVVSRSWGAAYGTVVYIAGDDGLDWAYCHLSRRSVRPGQRVRTGQRIGTSGATGRVFGAHLHLEARRRHGGYGADVNPNRWP